MKKSLPTILLVMVFILGLLIMLYPTISELYNSSVNSYVISNYTETINSSTKEEFKEMLEEASFYNRNLQTDTYISGAPQDPIYINTLNVANGMMGYLKIGKINVSLPIYHGTDEAVLQKYVGHLEGSSLPTGDAGNHAVMTGHTGLPSANLLTNLDKMEMNDTFEVVVLNQVFTYQVFNITVVEPDEVDDLQPVAGLDIVTLITCTPYGINSHRLLVQGRQIEVFDVPTFEITQTVVEQKFQFKVIPHVPMLIITIVMIILVVLHTIVFFKERR